MSFHATSRSGVKFPATPGITHGVSPTPPGGAKILQAGGRGGTGNILYVFPNEQPPLVLKVFRPRRSRFREFLKNFSERVLEGKRGATAAIRCATEKLNLELWMREGFEVVKPVARALPAGLMLPALWLLHCDAPLLWEVLADFTRSLETRLPLVELLGLSLSCRHTRAVELQEPLLIHEHGHIKHFFIREGRLVAFDLEHGFKPEYPVVKAVARELAGITTSLARADAAAADDFLRVFVASYVNKTLLKLAVREALHGGGLIDRLRRWHERGHPSHLGKTQVLARLEALLDAG